MPMPATPAQHTPATGNKTPVSSGGAAASSSGAEKLKRIGNWILGETLGQGSFGKVKLAHHAQTKEKVTTRNTQVHMHALACVHARSGVWKSELSLHARV
jgi:hypothetical protein